MKDKVVIVTGAAQGIGKCIKESFEQCGAHVCTFDIQQNDYFVGDLSKKEDIETFMEKVIGQYGHVDYLINNAIPMMKGIHDCTYEEFQNALSIGVTAPFYLAKLCMPYFAPGASIINITSSRDAMSQKETESYTAAKGGISSLTHGLAMSLGPHVRVNAIAPGWIDTKGNTYTGADALQHPVGRVGNPHDIADLVLYLCSEKAGFITGQTIYVDGGMSKKMIYHDDEDWSYQPK